MYVTLKIPMSTYMYLLFKQKKNICVFITLGKNSVFRIKELKAVNANKIINMLPYTKVKKNPKQTLTYNMSI